MSLVTLAINVLATNTVLSSINEALSVARPAFPALHAAMTQVAVYSMAMSFAAIHGYRICVAGMTASAFHFDLYAGLSCGTMLQTWHACRSRRHDQAREHGMACFVHVIAAFLQWNT